MYLRKSQGRWEDERRRASSFFAAFASREHLCELICAFVDARLRVLCSILEGLLRALCVYSIEEGSAERVCIEETRINLSRRTYTSTYTVFNSRQCALLSISPLLSCRKYVVVGRTRYRWVRSTYVGNWSEIFTPPKWVVWCEFVVLGISNGCHLSAREGERVEQ